MSSWWCALHGYNHPQLTPATKSANDAMSHAVWRYHPCPPLSCAANRLAMTPTAGVRFSRGLRLRSGRSGDENGVAVLAGER
ncbi:hypothetical protein ACNKHN_04095 [Shigella flexneri]